MLLLAGIISIVYHGGLNYGIDFSGGTLIQIKFHQPVDVNTLRQDVQGLGLGNYVIQQIGEPKDNEVIIRVQETTSDLSGLGNQIKEHLEKKMGKEQFEVRRVEMVGPQVGKDLRQKALWAIIGP